MTLMEYILFAEKNFPGNDINIKRYDAELILSHILKIKRIDIYINKDLKLNKGLVNKINIFFKRRINDEPIQYILGTAQFRSIELEVNNTVLIPRPETEILVDYVIDKLKSYSNPIVADVGTGPGTIGLSILSEVKTATVVSIDVSQNALNLAKKNKRLNNLEGIYFIKGSLIESIVPEKLDMIVANLPYVSIAEYEKLDKNVKEYEPKKALTDGNSGTDLIKKLIVQASEKLKNNGWIFLEIGYEQGNIVSQFLKNNNFKKISIIKDFNNLDRIIRGQK